MATEIKQKKGKSYIYIDGVDCGEFIPKTKDSKEMANLLDTIQNEGKSKKASTKKMKYRIASIETNDINTEILFILHEESILKYRLIDHTMWFNDQPATKTGISKIITGLKETPEAVTGPLWLHLFVRAICKINAGRVEKFSTVLNDLPKEKVILYEMLSKQEVVTTDGYSYSGYESFVSWADFSVLEEKKPTLSKILGITNKETEILFYGNKKIDGDVFVYYSKLRDNKPKTEYSYDTNQYVPIETVIEGDRNKQGIFYTWALLNKENEVLIESDRNPGRPANDEFASLVEDLPHYTINRGPLELISTLLHHLDFDNNRMWEYVTVDLPRQGYDVDEGSRCSEYSDYIRMCKEYNGNLVKYSQHLSSDHYLMTRNIRIVKDEQLQDAFDNKQEMWNEYVYKSNTQKYCVIIPKSPEDLVLEGTALHHCVGSYTKRVLKGETLILFLRDRETPKIPLVTFEVRDTNIVGQVSAAYNRRPNQEIMDFIEYYKEHVLKDIDKKLEAIYAEHNKLAV